MFLSNPSVSFCFLDQSCWRKAHATKINLKMKRLFYLNNFTNTLKNKSKKCLLIPFPLIIGNNVSLIIKAQFLNLLLTHPSSLCLVLPKTGNAFFLACNQLLPFHSSTILGQKNFPSSAKKQILMRNTALTSYNPCMSRQI